MRRSCTWQRHSTLTVTMATEAGQPQLNAFEPIPLQVLFAFRELLNAVVVDGPARAHRVAPVTSQWSDRSRSFAAVIRASV